MIRITKLTDYGIVLLSHLAEAPERFYNAPELAGEARLPAPMVSKILKQLARAGILESQRGVHGGYALTRPPQDVTVAEIITALEGPIAMTECTEAAPGLCDIESWCQVRDNWLRINRAIQDALEAITLAEMSHPSARLVTLGGQRPAAGPR